MFGSSIFAVMCRMQSSPSVWYGNSLQESSMIYLPGTDRDLVHINVEATMNNATINNALYAFC